MNSGNMEIAGSLRKRTLSRGMSEDESLRHIIKEAEESARHLTRSDSRCGSLKRGPKQESHSEDDLLSENIEMIDLQANYEDCLQELRTLELHQETLLFQVDCLQDALEGAEEMLAEAQRETHNVTMELEQEREARKKLENMVGSLLQEIERLREERNSLIPVKNLMGDTAQGVQKGLDEGIDDSTVKERPIGTCVDGDVSKEGMTTVHLNMVSQTSVSTEGSLGSFFRRGKSEAVQLRLGGPIWLQSAPEGTSVDQEEKSLSDTESSQVDQKGPLLQSKEIVNQKSSQSVQNNQQCEAHDVDDNDESSGYEDAPSEFSPSCSTPDVQPDGSLLEGEIDGDDGRMDYGSSIPKSADSCALS